MTEHKGVTHFPAVRWRLPPGLGALTHGVLVVIAAGEDELDVAARLAWTSAASRRATGKPGAAGIRAPPH